MSLCQKKEHRDFLRVIMMLDPTIIPFVRQIIRWRVSDLRPDYMLIRQANGTVIQLPDPGAWNGTLPNVRMSFCLIRHRDGIWAIHS